MNGLLVKVQRAKAISVIMLAFCCVLIFCGCASFREGMKGFLGISTKDIEDSKDKAIVKIVDCDFSSCYQRVEEILSEIGSHIYSKRKDLIAVYISQTDTTPAGIFFKQINEYKTELSIASPAKDTKEYLAVKIFPALEGR
jgi:hypothetical protein